MANGFVSRVPKKRGRPKGSKNKRKSRRRNDATAADDAFKEAFKDTIPAIDNIDEIIEEDSNKRQVRNRGDDDSEQTETFGTDLLPVGHDDDEGYDGYDDDGRGREEAATNDEIDDDNVGFGSADMYDVEQLLELAKMDLKGTAKESEDAIGTTTDDIIKDLRVGCVSNSSKKLYESSNVLFLFYHFKYNKHLMHNTWIKTINSFSHGIQDEAKKNRSIKRTIRKLLQKADETCPPIDFKLYTAKDLLIYLLSLRTKKNTRLSSASYNGKRSSYFHLCRMYGVKQNEEFMGQITVLFKGLKRSIAKEKQDGEGKIQTGKIPMSYLL